MEPAICPNCENKLSGKDKKCPSCGSYAARRLSNVGTCGCVVMIGIVFLFFLKWYVVDYLHFRG